MDLLLDLSDTYVMDGAYKSLGKPAAAPGRY